MSGEAARADDGITTVHCEEDPHDSVSVVHESASAGHVTLKIALGGLCGAIVLSPGSAVRLAHALELCAQAARAAAATCDDASCDVCSAGSGEPR